MSGDLGISDMRALVAGPRLRESKIDSPQPALSFALV